MMLPSVAVVIASSRMVELHPPRLVRFDFWTHHEAAGGAATATGEFQSVVLGCDCQRLSGRTPACWTTRRSAKESNLNNVAGTVGRAETVTALTEPSSATQGCFS